MVPKKESTALLVKLDKALAPDPFAVGESSESDADLFHGFGLCPQCGDDICSDCMVKIVLDGTPQYYGYDVFDIYATHYSVNNDDIAAIVRNHDQSAVTQQACTEARTARTELLWGLMDETHRWRS